MFTDGLAAHPTRMSAGAATLRIVGARVRVARRWSVSVGIVGQWENDTLSTSEAKASFDRHTSRWAGESGWEAQAARAGLAAKGFLYATIAVLSLRLAFGSGGQTAGQSGALKSLQGGTFGTIILVLLAIGLAAYGIWRLLQVFQDPGEDSQAKNIGLRISFAVRFVIYAGLSILTVRLLMGSSSGGGSSKKTLTATVMGWPGGTWLIGAVGLIVIGVGLYQGYKGWESKFMEDLDTRDMSAKEYRWVDRLGTAGSLARMVVFTISGIFVVIAAVNHQPGQVKGLDGALQQLRQASYGPWLLGIVALGLLAYGVFCFAQSRYVDSDAS